MKRLEIGPGEHPRVGDEWTFLDSVSRPGVDHVCVWGSQRLPFDDSTMDEVYASHCLEHVPWYQVEYAIEEVYRVLVPGGIFEVWVPDFGYIVNCYLQSRCGDSWRRYNIEGDWMKWVQGRVFAYGSHENWHKSCFDEVYLRRLLKNAGFNFAITRQRLVGQPHGPIDLGCVAQKPMEERT